MKLKNIEVLLKNAKGVRHQIKARNGIIRKVTSFGYQLVSEDAADKIFEELSVALEERDILVQLASDLNEVYYSLPLSERKVLHFMSCDELTLQEASMQLKCLQADVRTTYRRAMRAMSQRLMDKGYDDSTVGLFVGTGGILTNG